MEKKSRSLRNEKLIANSASETEEQMKESMRIRREKIEHEGKRKGRQKQQTTRNWTRECNC